jgi:hypothetical protein
VIVQWVAPDDGGSPITHYTVEIRQADSVTFSTELTQCDGSDPTIRDNTECTIAVTTLQGVSGAPFSLDWGTDVHAKVTAWNVYGNYGASDIGNGAVITTFPDPPISFVEYYPDRDPTTIGFTWSQAAFNGGATIEDYRILYRIVDETNNGLRVAIDEGRQFEVLVSGLLSARYTATELVTGAVYEFKVQSRNSYDYSADSASIIELIAFKPEQPAAPVTFRVTNQMTI